MYNQNFGGKFINFLIICNFSLELSKKYLNLHFFNIIPFLQQHTMRQKGIFHYKEISTVTGQWSECTAALKIWAFEIWAAKGLLTRA